MAKQRALAFNPMRMYIKVHNRLRRSNIARGHTLLRQWPCNVLSTLAVTSDNFIESSGDVWRAPTRQHESMTQPWGKKKTTCGKKINHLPNAFGRCERNNILEK